MPFYFEHQACANDASRNFQELAEHMKNCEAEGAEFRVRFVDQATAQKQRREVAAATR